MERAVRVRHDDQVQAERAKAFERGRDIGGDRLPQVLRRVVRVQLGEGRFSGRSELDACFGEDQVEVHPAALQICRPLNRVAEIEASLRARIGRGQRDCVDLHAVARQRIADARPIWEHEHAAGIQKERLDRHRSSIPRSC